MNPSFTIAGPHLGLSAACAPILEALPEWFGNAAARQQYIRNIDSLPTFLATDDEKNVLGFLSILQHNRYTAEVYVMGVLPAAHHQGIGRALVEAAETWLRRQAVEYLQVKTLGPSNADPHYVGTRAFYEALRFRPLEEFTQIWDENNPCLILVKRL